jgi:hypothetical protein
MDRRKQAGNMTPKDRKRSRSKQIISKEKKDQF